MNLLASIRVRPSLVFFFEQQEDEAIRRLQSRRIDPQTGNLYNLTLNPPSDEVVAARLIELKEDKPEVVKKRYETWG